MKNILNILLPKQVDNRLRGPQIPLYIFALYALISTVRSCIHLLAPDGGAGSIAGMDLSVAGASGIVFAFALWGSAQLLLPSSTFGGGALPRAGADDVPAAGCRDSAAHVRGRQQAGQLRAHPARCVWQLDGAAGLYNYADLVSVER